MFKFLSQLDYLLRETFLGLQRGGWINWAAVSTVTVLLFLFGISWQASWQLGGLLNQLGSQLEVAVYLEPGAEAEMVLPAVQKLPKVMAVQTISKEKAWASLVEELGISDIAAATEQLEGNPLVDELKVKVSKPKDVLILAQQLSQLPGIDEVQYMDQTLKQMRQLHHGLGWVSLIITTILSLTAVAVVTTTMRLIVIARRQEIEIMQLVGATRSWIYLPFMLQGITFGIAGAALAWVLLIGMRQFLTNLLATGPDFIEFIATVVPPDPLKIVVLPLLLLILGGSVGLLGSCLAVSLESIAIGK